VPSYFTCTNQWPLLFKLPQNTFKRTTARCVHRCASSHVVSTRWCSTTLHSRNASTAVRKLWWALDWSADATLPLAWTLDKLECSPLWSISCADVWKPSLRQYWLWRRIKKKFASEIRTTQPGVSNVCEIIFHTELSCLSLNIGGYFKYHSYERTNKMSVKPFCLFSSYTQPAKLAKYLRCDYRRIQGVYNVTP
jgi:hypothetical protein